MHGAVVGGGADGLHRFSDQQEPDYLAPPAPARTRARSELPRVAFCSEALVPKIYGRERTLADARPGINVDAGPRASKGSSDHVPLEGGVAGRVRMLSGEPVMSAEAWTIIGVGVAILGFGGIAYRELRSDIRGLRADVSELRERMARLEGPSVGDLLRSRGDDSAGT